MNLITKLLIAVRELVLPGTFGEGKRAFFTGIVATIYQLIIYGVVVASIYNSFTLYLRFGRINSFLTIYSDLNGIETPSLIYCKSRINSRKDPNMSNLKVLMRILYRNKYYYSDTQNIRVCNYKDANCLCIDTWKQTYYNFDKILNNTKSTSYSNSSIDYDQMIMDEILKFDFDNTSIFPPGEFPIPNFMKNELDYDLSSTISIVSNENEDIKYKPHLINWCDLNLPEVENTRKITFNSYDVDSSVKRGLRITNTNNSKKNINDKSNQDIYCEKKDMVEFLFISENKLDQGNIGFYTSRQDLTTEPMWVRTSFPGVIFAFLQLEKNWIIDFYIIKLFFYHKLNPLNYLIKYFTNRNNDSQTNSTNSSLSSINNPNDKNNPSDRVELKQNAYFVSESHQLVADIAQIHDKVLPENWLKWFILHDILLSSNGDVNKSKLKSEMITNYINNANFIDKIENHYSTLWVRAEYQIFVTPNTVRVANKHFLLKTFGLIMSIIFSLNYLNLFYSVFPFYRGETPKLTVSPLMKFLSCNILNSYHK